MERYCSTSQSPQRAVAPTEEEEDKVVKQRVNKVRRNENSDFVEKMARTVVITFGMGSGANSITDSSACYS